MGQYRGTEFFSLQWRSSVSDKLTWRGMTERETNKVLIASRIQIYYRNDIGDLISKYRINE